MQSRVFGLIVAVVALLAFSSVVMLAQTPRRDPFKALVVVDPTSQADPFLACANKTGKSKLVIGQLQVQGFGRSVDGTWIAVVDNNTNRAYFLREGDKLYNGTVSAVSPDHVVFMEETTDARGQKSTREVVKRLPED